MHHRIEDFGGSLEDQRIRFQDEWASFMLETHRIDVDLLPSKSIEGVVIDNFDLYKLVLKYGGDEKLNRDKSWTKAVASALHIPRTCLSASFFLKTHFEKYLSQFLSKKEKQSENEKTKSGKSEAGGVDENKRPRNDLSSGKKMPKSKRRRVPRNTVFSQFAPHSHPLVHKDFFGRAGGHRLTMALLSPIAAERSWSLDMLLRLTCDEESLLELSDCPFLIPSLTQYILSPCQRDKPLHYDSAPSGDDEDLDKTADQGILSGAEGDLTTSINLSDQREPAEKLDSSYGSSAAVTEEVIGEKARWEWHEIQYEGDLLPSNIRCTHYGRQRHACASQGRLPRYPTPRKPDSTTCKPCKDRANSMQRFFKRQRRARRQGALLNLETTPTRVKRSAQSAKAQEIMRLRKLAARKKPLKYPLSLSLPPFLGSNFLKENESGGYESVRENIAARLYDPEAHLLDPGAQHALTIIFNLSKVSRNRKLLAGENELVQALLVLALPPARTALQDGSLKLSGLAACMGAGQKQRDRCCVKSVSIEIQRVAVRTLLALSPFLDLSNLERGKDWAIHLVDIVCEAAPIVDLQVLRQLWPKDKKIMHSHSSHAFHARDCSIVKPGVAVVTEAQLDDYSGLPADALSVCALSSCTMRLESCSEAYQVIATPVVAKKAGSVHSSTSLGTEGGNDVDGARPQHHQTLAIAEPESLDVGVRPMELVEAINEKIENNRPQQQVPEMSVEEKRWKAQNNRKSHVLRCPECESVAYCSESHKNIDWGSSHKKVCKRLKDSRLEALAIHNSEVQNRKMQRRREHAIGDMSEAERKALAFWQGLIRQPYEALTAISRCFLALENQSILLHAAQHPTCTSLTVEASSSTQNSTAAGLTKRESLGLFLSQVAAFAGLGVSMPDRLLRLCGSVRGPVTRPGLALRIASLECLLKLSAASTLAREVLTSCDKVVPESAISSASRSESASLGSRVANLLIQTLREGLEDGSRRRIPHPSVLGTEASTNTSSAAPEPTENNFPKCDEGDLSLQYGCAAMDEGLMRLRRTAAALLNCLYTVTSKHRKGLEASSNNGTAAIGGSEESRVEQERLLSQLRRMKCEVYIIDLESICLEH